ncbi:MAG TPA: hypothetical protein VJI68_03290 [Candidatus Nanoarchaeia archaeon]|nr:hypothetical protein [Candidatus Nanoarchaeia archaeon]
MAKGSTLGMIGAWSFIIGAVIALILGAIPSTAGTPWVIGVLLVLGVIVGFLNVTEKEIVPFLVACIALLVAVPTFGAAVGGFGSTFGWLTRILLHIGVFVVPAAIIASIKAIVAITSN